MLGLGKWLPPQTFFAGAVIVAYTKPRRITEPVNICGTGIEKPIEAKKRGVKIVEMGVW